MALRQGWISYRMLRAMQAPHCGPLTSAASSR
jgi:hypothetical protein